MYLDFLLSSIESSGCGGVLSRVFEVNRENTEEVLVEEFLDVPVDNVAGVREFDGVWRFLSGMKFLKAGARCLALALSIPRKQPSLDWLITIRRVSIILPLSCAG